MKTESFYSTPNARVVKFIKGLIELNESRNMDLSFSYGLTSGCDSMICIFLFDFYLKCDRVFDLNSQKLHIPRY